MIDVYNTKKYLSKILFIFILKKKGVFGMNKLTNLAEMVGISSSYIDKTGKKHDTPDDVRRFFLEAMGIKAKNDNEIEAEIKRVLEPLLIEEVLAFYEDEEILIKIKANGVFKVILSNEDGELVEELKVNGNEDFSFRVSEFGYYNLKVEEEGGDKKAESFIIYAPKYCYLPQFIKNKEHIFGVSLMMYALKSENSIGIGDFGDLEEIVKLTAKNGGDVVGLSPLGAMSPYTLPKSILNMFKGDVSPYRTLSRLFINYAYISLKDVEDYKNSADVLSFMNDEGVKNEIRRLNESDKVLYTPVLMLKLKILTMMYKEFIKNGSIERKNEFLRYKDEKGEELYNLCLFEALLERNRGVPFWRFWMDGTDDINSLVTRKFADENKERIDVFAYCHWLADLQLKKLQNLAIELGMKVGLYTDMPIGAASNGAEVWENTEAYVLDAGIGAPADPMRPRGQSWGFTPYHPHVLRKQKYAPFIKLARENMINSGALRIDHAMGLLRLFWGFFEEGNPVVQGAYVYYDMKVLTAILAVESNRAKCLIIGEDLGTVPEGFREYMAEHGLLSYKVFFRQKEKDGSFIKPCNYDYMSLAQSSTHDQATSVGFWCNEDIEVFKKCGLYVNDEQYVSNLQGRQKDRVNMIKAFDELGIVDEKLKGEMIDSAEKGDDVPDGIERVVNVFGAKTNSALYLVRLCDIFAQKVLDNAPGTIDEYTNWRVKLGCDIEMIKKSDCFENVMNDIKKYRS